MTTRPDIALRNPKPPTRNSDRTKSLAWQPDVDVDETDREFLITADLPDVRKDDLKLSIAGGLLTLHCLRRREDSGEESIHHVRERGYGPCSRHFQLPKQVDPSNIEARFEAGVLRIHLPKCLSPPGNHREIAVR